MSESINPSPKVIPVTPHNTTNFTNEIRQLYVGVQGDIVVVNQDNTTCTFSSVPSGSILGPFYIKRVNATGTTATNIIGFE
jgi:hypothetical protein